MTLGIKIPRNTFRMKGHKKSTYYLSTNDNTVVTEKATAKKSIM